MNRLTAAALVLATFLGASPAFATGGVYCDGARDKDVGAFLTVGRVPGFAVVDAVITTKDRAWTIRAQDGAAPIVLVQGAVIGDLTVADFADPNVENIVASLRVVRADNEQGFAAAGVLSIPGVGAWPLVCEID